MKTSWVLPHFIKISVHSSPTHQRCKRRRGPLPFMSIFIPRRYRSLAMLLSTSLHANGEPFCMSLLSSYIPIPRHPSEKVTQARHDETTSNLICHAENCNPDGCAALKSMTAFANAYTPGKFRVNIALWISHRHWLFSIVEDPEFIDLLVSLNNKVSVPSRTTFSHDIQEIFAVPQASVATLLQVSFFFSTTDDTYCG
jgi:hypothetical protein